MFGSGVFRMGCNAILLGPRWDPWGASHNQIVDNSSHSSSSGGVSRPFCPHPKKHIDPTTSNCLERQNMEINHRPVKVNWNLYWPRITQTLGIPFAHNALAKRG